MSTDRLINQSQGDAIISALQVIASSGLSIRIVPTRESGDEVGQIIVNGTTATLYADPHTEQFDKLSGIATGGKAVPDTRTINGKALSDNVTLGKGDVGLGNVDNTSDAAKPVSTAQQAALDTKVDKVTGKGLSQENYTTADKTKLAGIQSGAEVNVVDEEAYHALIRENNTLRQRLDITQKQLDNLLSGLEIPVYINAAGNGIIAVEDSTSGGNLKTVTVDPALSGQTLYISVRTGSGASYKRYDTTVVPGSDGVGTLNIPLQRGFTEVSVTASAYPFPMNTAAVPSGKAPRDGYFEKSSYNGMNLYTPSGDNAAVSGKTYYAPGACSTGSYTNKWTDENGHTHYDGWTPPNPVQAVVRYERDKTLGNMVDMTISYDAFLASLGLGVDYVRCQDTAAAIARYNDGQKIYAVSTFSGSSESPEYATVNPNSGGFSVYYYAEYYYLST